MTEHAHFGRHFLHLPGGHWLFSPGYFAFAALTDSTRSAILMRLAKGETTVIVPAVYVAEAIYETECIP